MKLDLLLEKRLKFHRKELNRYLRQNKKAIQEKEYSTAKYCYCRANEELMVCDELELILKVLKK